MIYIFIGQSGAGKTTAAKKLLPPPYNLKKDLTYYTEASNGNVGIGKYGIGIRTEGTDTLSYNAQELIRQQIKALDGRNIILEGDRITNQKTFDFIAKSGYKAKLYLVRCPIKTSIERLRAAGSKITEGFVKATRTKSERLFFNYERIFDGEIIDT